MTLARIAIRQQRTGLIAMTVLTTAAGILNALGFVQIAGESDAERLAFARQMEILGAQLSYMLPVPEGLHTVAGFLQWRAYGLIVLILGLWAVISATGSGRGDEERGLVEQWLAAGASRTRYIVARVVVFVVIAVAALSVGMLLTYVATVGAGESLSATGMVATGVNLLVNTLVCFGIGLSIAQLVTTRRAAGMAAAGLLIALFLMNGAVRNADVGAARWLTPFYLFERSKPLTRDGALDGFALALLLLVAVALIAFAVVAFIRRDLGATALSRAAHGSRSTLAPSHDPFLRLPVVALLRWEWLSTALSIAAIAAMSGFLASLTKTIIDTLMSSSVPFMRAYFERAGLTAYDSVVGAIWLTTLMLILSAYAIVQVQAWSNDDAEGRLATVLTAPVSRGRVVIERMVAFLVAMTLVCAAAGYSVYLVASSQSLPLDPAKLALATALVISIPFAFSAIGQLLAVWRPRLSVVLLSTLAVTSYLVLQFSPLFQWPEWVANLSLYALFGTPMSGDVNWSGIAALVGVGLAATVGAVIAFQRRDVGA
ncbi:MAG TPA: ABC transporter permease subunit [Candidatus Limnocylindria bacterium]|nr:ABC transporter permease subunit [Candidatus Limnocylindria bacterium]